MYTAKRKDGKWYSPNWRAEKRMFRYPASYEAYLNGQAARELPKHKRKNHYPVGLRHDEFERGLNLQEEV